MRSFYLFIFFIIAADSFAQTFSLSGKVVFEGSQKPVSEAEVTLHNTSYNTRTDFSGNYFIGNIPPGNYTLTVFKPGLNSITRPIKIKDKDVIADFKTDSLKKELKDVTITAKEKEGFGITRLRNVEENAIYAGKKTEVIVLDDIAANLATNNSRQVFSKVAGLNIWESDGAGIQLGIGGRGLNPNRVSNFNTRQNGYDISADALGYPESYYSPPTEALDRIEIVRGAASLQYGTQFGGFVNFRFKKGAEDKPVEVATRQTVGSFGFYNSFNSIGGTKGKINYYSFFQHKQGNGWRPNSEFNVNTAHISVNFAATEKLKITGEYTLMDYLAHQPGGLTDKQFEANPRQSFRERNWFKVNWNLAALMGTYTFSPYLRINTINFALLASRSAIGNLGPITRADPLTERNFLSDDYRNFGNETRLILNYNLLENISTFLIGTRYYNGFTDRKQGLGNKESTPDFYYLNPGNPEHSKYTFPSSNLAFFAENIFQVTSKVSVTPGMRYEIINTNSNGYYNEEYRDLAGNIIFQQQVKDNRSNERSFFLFGTGVSYKSSEKFETYANFSQNYRSINFNDMRIVNPNFRVDPDLKDENGYSSDAGVRGATNIISYDISFFLMKYNDRIGSVFKTDSILFNTYRFRTNISDSRTYGLESFIEADILKFIKDSAQSRLSIFSNLSIIEARYINSEQAAYLNKKVELAPSLIFKTGISFKRKNIKASFQYSYTSMQFTDATNSIFDNTAVNGIIPSYNVLDVFFEYSFKKYFSVSTGINNLTNNFYFTRRAEGYPGPGIIPSDGRSLFFTLQVKI